MPRPTRTTLGRRIEAARRARALSRETLARLATVGRSTVWRIETGRGTQPSAALLARLATALGTTSEALLA